MMKIFLLLLVVVSEMSYSSDFNPQAEYIENNSCPFECCSYRNWQVQEQTTLFKHKDEKSEAIALLTKGQNVEAVTGDIHIKPLKLTFKKDYKNFKKGEVVWILNYLGEGIYNAWSNDELVEIELPFSPYQPMEIPDWAQFDGIYHAVWWVKITSPSGLVGWSNRVEHFSNKDSCS